MNMYYNLFLDDERDPSMGMYWTLNENNEQTLLRERPLLNWKVVRNARDFIKIITQDGLPNVISFDHDLHPEHYVEGRAALPPRYGSYKEPTGYECAVWLVEYCRQMKAPFPKYYVHSFSMHGRNNIFNVIENYRKEYEKLETKTTNPG